jgi:hypothetical protein
MFHGSYPRLPVSRSAWPSKILVVSSWVTEIAWGMPTRSPAILGQFSGRSLHGGTSRRMPQALKCPTVRHLGPWSVLIFDDSSAVSTYRFRQHRRKQRKRRTEMGKKAAFPEPKTSHHPVTGTRSRKHAGERLSAFVSFVFFCVQLNSHGSVARENHVRVAFVPRRAWRSSKSARICAAD